MKIDVNNNIVILNNNNQKTEIHPLWLRERVNEKEYLDNKTKQRLFDPSILEKIEIKSAIIEDNTLKLIFNDGVSSIFQIDQLKSEFLDSDNLLNTVKPCLWDSSFKDTPKYSYKKNFVESEEMFNLLKSFYKYGFVIIKNLPTENNYIINFANSIGNVRPTNFGEFFNVKSVPNPIDLAYTSLALSPHTDNPYRKPVPCIQMLHCIENEVTGGLSNCRAARPSRCGAPSIADDGR